MRSPILAVILLVSLILAIVIGMVFVLRSAGSSAPIDSLPRDTSFLVRAIDPPKLWRDLSRTRLTQREGNETLDWLARLVSDALERRGFPVAISSSMIAQTMRLESLIALVPGDAEEPDGLALVVDLGTAAAAVPEIARSYVRTTLGARGDGAWVPRSHHGREYLTLRLPGGLGGVSVAGLKGLGIVTTSGASLRRILDTLDGRADSLRSDPAYRTTRDHLGKRADLLAYVSGSWLRDRIEKRPESSEEQRLLKLLGLSSLRAVGLEIDLVRDQFKERLFVGMQRENRGLTAELFKDAPRAPSGYRSIPSGFPFYLSLTYTGLDTLYRKLPEIVSSATGEDRRKIHERLAGFEEFMALDFGSELFAALGHELVVGFGGASPLPRSAPNRVILNTPAVAAISLRDQGAVGRVLQRLDGLARAMTAFRSLGTERQPITAYDFTGLAPLSPAYRLSGGQLIAATSPDLLAQAFDAASRHRSFVDEPRFAAMTQRLPDRSHIGFLGETARIADFLQTHVRCAVPPGPLSESPFETLLDLSRATDLPPTAATARMTEGGLLVDWISPVSPSFILSLCLASDAGDQARPANGQASTLEGEIPY